MLKEQKLETPVDKTINTKKILSLNGDLKRMRTSNKTTIEKRNKKK
jgi:hypothetical protein